MYIIDITMQLEIREALFIYQLRDEEKIRWHSRVHSHRSGEYELHYFLSGGGSFRMDKTTYTIRPGSLFLCSPGCVHTIRPEGSGQPLSYYAILFFTSDETELFELLQKICRREIHSNIGVTYRFFFEELKEKSSSTSFARRCSGMHQFLSFLYLLDEGEEAFRYGSGGNRHIERALKIMQNSVEERLDLSQLCRKLELSESYFIRLFRQKMKISPMKYFNRLKIEAASAYLLGTNRPACRIAEQLGFYSEFHFSKRFKQHTGYSPRAYRQLHHNS